MGLPPAPIPRFGDEDHGAAAAAARRELCERAAGRELPHLAGRPVPPEAARGKVENLVGYAQVPVGIAGPLRVETSRGAREVYVPMATTEGALVASHSRGMRCLARAGGARARVVREGLSQHPMLVYDDAASALAAARVAETRLAGFRDLVAGQSRHGALVGLRARPVGRRVVLELDFTTGDAIGINMAARASDTIAARLAAETGARTYYVHGEDVEKRANVRAFAEGRGRSVFAEARLPADVLKDVLRVEAADLAAIRRSYALGFARLGTDNHLVQAANGIAAVYLACGQDVAYVGESAVGWLDLEVEPGGELHACAFLPALLVGTVGGGSGQGTARECLDLLGVAGDGGANELAEILAATVLAGDLSLLASFCTHEFVAAHERLGRNRPERRG